MAKPETEPILHPEASKYAIFEKPDNRTKNRIRDMKVGINQVQMVLIPCCKRIMMINSKNQVNLTCLEFVED